MLPDVVPIVRGFLRADSAVTALVGSRVYAHRLPADPPRDVGLLLVTPITETSVTDTRIDRTVDTTIQLEAWGRYLEDHAFARDIVATAHARLRVALTSYTHENGKVSAVLADLGVQPLPDDELARARAMAAVRIIAYPHLSPVA